MIQITHCNTWHTHCEGFPGLMISPSNAAVCDGTFDQFKSRNTIKNAEHISLVNVQGSGLEQASVGMVFTRFFLDDETLVVETVS